MKFPIKIKIIITKNHEQFLTWCRKNKVNPKDKFVRYVHSRE